MNSFVAYGKIVDLKKKESSTGKPFYSFILEVPVRGPGQKELITNKYCTLWSFMGDRRPENLIEGAQIVASGKIEGYEKESTMGKTFVNEKFIVEDVCTVVPSLETIGAKDEKNEPPF